MTISRWKVMAGVLGVSIGGLAAIAGQGPKPDAAKTQHAADQPATPEALKPLPAGGGPAAPTAKPTAPAAPAFDLSALPPPGELLAPPAAAPKLPAVPPPPAPTPKSADSTAQPTKNTDLFVLPATAKPDMPKPAVVPTGASVLPPTGPMTPLVPPVAIEATKPAAPLSIDPPHPTPAKPSGPIAAAPELPKPVSGEPTPAKPTPIEFTKVAGPSAPPAAAGRPVPPATLIEAVPPGPEATVETASPRLTTPTVAPAQALTKFRIVLRVGEGEPMFEVRHGDDLVMKVVCEKVDIKSPEKGQGLSAVTATGKVRFVGFGAEGTCEAFSFLAGTGEVSMTGNVKVQVKDKIGRVESELTTEKMQYRLDSHAMPGVLKP